MAQNGPHGLKTANKDLSEHRKWSRNNFEKKSFFRPGDPGGPTVGPRLHGLCCPPATRNDHSYGGLGIRLGDSGLGSFLEKRGFDPFLTHFWS